MHVRQKSSHSGLEAHLQINSRFPLHKFAAVAICFNQDFPPFKVQLGSLVDIESISLKTAEQATSPAEENHPRAWTFAILNPDFEITSATLILQSRRASSNPKNSS